MSAADDLEVIADKMADILSRFRRDRDGVHIADGDEARFRGLVIEARDILSEALGSANTVGLQLESERFRGTLNYIGTQSYRSVEQSAGIVHAAVKVLRRRAANPPQQSTGTITASPYVSLSRVDELRAVPSTTWDLKRLIRLCEEINSSFANGNLLATGMLLRAVADHVPPIFGVKTFNEYANSIAGRSHKETMQHLQNSLRSIADSFLHDPIRSKEVLPTASRVDFRQDFDVLLGEIVRKLG